MLHEGTFRVSTIDETEDGLIVTATATGISATFRFERLNSGYFYEQLGADGPFEAMETTLLYERANGATDLTMTSEVSLGVRPRTLVDWIGAWKRRGELKRALRSIAKEFA